MLPTERIERQAIFDSEYVQQLIKDHETGRASHHKELWTLLVFQLWCDNFLSVSK